MVSTQKKIRALGLCSGGLDSILASVVLQEQGIDVEWVSFETPFFSADKARKAARNTGIPLTVRNITPVYLKMLKNPRCGYGQHMNPCLDCHALMFRLAGEIMREREFDFLFSGEVMGQRPMSQTKSSLRYVEKNSGFEGYIVRPLSIRRLPETLPEQQGLISRESLYGLAGRSRKPQMELARKFGISDYPNPAGGCLLTDKNYCVRLRDLFKHQDAYTEDELHLLRYGRHFRLDEHTKVVVGRDKRDNEALLRHYVPETDTFIKTQTVPGPVVIIPNGGPRENIVLAAGICAGYSKVPHHTLIDVGVTTPGGQQKIQIKSIPPAEVKQFMI